MCWIDEIAGYGVFAGRPYHQHEFIALYSGIIILHLRYNSALKLMVSRLQQVC